MFEQLSKDIWPTKIEYYKVFPIAMKGSIKDRITFVDQCLEIDKDIDKAKPQGDLEVLKSDYTKILANEMKRYALFPIFSYLDFAEKETCELLGTAIIGKRDVKVGELIEYLGNSDWVQQGFRYRIKSKNLCPFCQRDMGDELFDKINNYFDETYKINKEIVENFRATYSTYFTQYIDTLKAIDREIYDILDFDKWDTFIGELEARFKSNLVIIDYKLAHLSEEKEIVSLKGIIDEIGALCTSYNLTIKANNDVFAHLGDEKKRVRKEVWEYICFTIRPWLGIYSRGIELLDKQMVGINKGLKYALEDIERVNDEIKEKEKEVSNISSVADDINEILDLFGFASFKIAATKEKGSYKLIREGGDVVKETLSEGEYRFITFLYFYYLTKGSIKRDDISEKKVVVIDDPISSLDSNILYIVSSLVRDIVNWCVSGENGIEQIIILTHNTYFHKEITYGLQENQFIGAKSTYQCFIVKKKDKITNIEAVEGNPFKTSYDILWRTLDDPKQWEAPFVLNAMRRILEYYLCAICGYTKNDILKNVEKAKLPLCKSLLSYINDGSHFIYDDYVMCADNIENYMDAFEYIFVRIGQENHYKVMRDKSRNLTTKQ